MKIERIEIVPVKVPARPDSIHSPGVGKPLHMLSSGGVRPWSVQFDELPKLIYKVSAEGLTAWGESYRGVPLWEARAAAERLIGADPLKLPLRDLPLPSGRLYDGFECALFDLVGKALGVPAHRLLGGALRERVKVAFWTGQRTPADAVRKALEAVRGGFDTIKLKCDLKDDVAAWARGIGDACGEKLRVVLDPNGRFCTVAEAVRIARTLEAAGNVAMLEDPIPRWDLRGYRRIREQTAIPVAVHVALPYVELGQLPQDALEALREEACDAFNFNGGIAAFVRLADLAGLAGLECWHGNEVDLGILEAAYLHASAVAPSCTLPSDIFGRLVREHDLLERPIGIREGWAEVPEGPGLGVEVDEDALERYRTGAG